MPWPAEKSLRTQGPTCEHHILVRIFVSCFLLGSGLAWRGYLAAWRCCLAGLPGCLAKLPSCSHAPAPWLPGPPSAMRMCCVQVANVVLPRQTHGCTGNPTANFFIEKSMKFGAPVRAMYLSPKAGQYGDRELSVPTFIISNQTYSYPISPPAFHCQTFCQSRLVATLERHLGQHMRVRGEVTRSSGSMHYYKAPVHSSRS